MSTTAPIIQEFIASLAGRYDQLHDAQTISGESSRRFNTYIYSRKLLIRKSTEDDSGLHWQQLRPLFQVLILIEERVGHHLIYCTHCNRGPWRVPANFTTTSAQLRHLRRHHPRLPTSQEEENTRVRELGTAIVTGQPATPFTLATTQAMGRSGISQFDNKVFREYLAAFIVSSNSSLSLVENPNFHRLIQYCNNKARMISRRTLGHDIQTLYQALFQQVINRLQRHCDDGGRVSITLDAWSSSTRIPFLGITGHYIEGPTWQFKSVLLGFERLRGSHTADALSRVLLAVLQRFHLTKSVRGITTDNASTNNKMLRILEKTLPTFKAKENHIRCMAHIINLAVQELLSHLRVSPTDQVDQEIVSSSVGYIPKVFSQARSIIAKIRASNLLWESFEAQSAVAKLPPLKLILDMPVR